MADWKASATWEDDGDSWEDVAAVPSLPKAKPKTKPKPVAPPTVTSPTRAAAANTNGSFPTGATNAPASPAAASSNGAIATSDAALAAGERRVAALTRELQRARDVRTASSASAKEKDQEIAEVRAEGEQLSVKIAERETALRVAKTALRERDAEFESLRLAHDAAQAKIEAAAAKNRTLETSEKAAVQSKNAVERRLRQMDSEMRSQSASSAALDAARSQLETLRKSHTAALENQAMCLGAAADAELERVREALSAELETLNKSIVELRTSLSHVNNNAGWREDQLRREVTELRERAESLEARNEELAEAVPGATRPLLRQVEVLQAAASERARAVSAVERSQLNRIRTAEGALAASAERERAADARIGTLLARVASLEEQVRLSNAETARVCTELRTAQGSAAAADLANQRALDSRQANMMKISREKETAIDELTKARAAHLDDSEAADERDRLLRERLFRVEAKLEAAQVRTSKIHGACGDFTQSDSMSSLLVQGHSPRRRSTHASYDELSMIGAGLSGLGLGGNVDGTSSSINVSNVDAASGDSRVDQSSLAQGGMYDIQRLNSTLRQRADEIASLQSQLAGKDTATQALADEVVALTTLVDELTGELGSAPEMRVELDQLKIRHAALLELHGERDERILELEADLADVNDLFKQQISDLLMRIEQLTC
jgi:TATA element modulatory factor